MNSFIVWIHSLRRIDYPGEGKWIHIINELMSYMSSFVICSLTGTLLSWFRLGKYYLCTICYQLHCNVAFVWFILQAQHQCVTCPMGREILLQRQTSWAGKQVRVLSVYWESENSHPILHEPERRYCVEIFRNQKAGQIGWAPGKLDAIWTSSVCFVKQFNDGGVSTSHNSGEKLNECMWIHHFVILQLFHPKFRPVMSIFFKIIIRCLFVASTLMIEKIMRASLANSLVSIICGWVTLGRR
jgi:hypothetical protein